MFPALWFTIKVNKIRIPIPIFIIILLALAFELIAFLPLLILAIIKRKNLFFRLAFGFYLTSLMMSILLYGRGFRIDIRDGKERISIAGKWIRNSLDAPISDHKSVLN